MSTSVLTALALAVGAPQAKDAKRDPPGLVGEWAVESAVIGGKRDDPPPGTTWEFTADGKSVLSVPGGKDGAAGTYTTDAKKDPAWVDISAGPKGTPMKGVYKRDGETLTLCLALDRDGERPTAFESKVGAKVILITLTKAKKKE
jgi:uncharacterized protein (TIGR03067 family)